MGIRFNKRIKIAPGMHINLSLKRGISASIGPKGLSHNVGLDGRHRTTASLPGTGVSHVHEHAKPERQSGGAGIFGWLLLGVLILIVIAYVSN